MTSAYAELRDRGYLASRQGSGSVAALPGEAAAAQGTVLRALGRSKAGVIDLTCAAPGRRAGHGRRRTRRRSPSCRGYLAGTGYDPHGLPALREAIATRFTARGWPRAPTR